MKKGFAMKMRKKIINLRIKLRVFFHFLPQVFDNRMDLKAFVSFLRRLLFFLSKLQDNKYAKIGKKRKIDLYVPAFPSKAFYTACEKFKVFGKKLPCTTVLISITSTCRFKCKHCYQRLDKGKDVDIDILIKAIKKLQDMGIAFFNIEGGDPFIVYERLKKVCAVIDERAEIWINSTGDGITLERIRELEKLNVTGIMFSLHSAKKEALNEFMGRENAWEVMEEGIDLCHKGNMGIAFNTCLQRADFHNGTFEEIMEYAKDKKASIIQIIKPKSAGAWLEKEDNDFDKKELDFIKEKVNMYNLDKRYEDYPCISAQIMEEDENHFGCSAGGTDRFYINAKGDVQPCEFLNISFGNIEEADFEKIYEKMRSYFEKPGTCWLCERYHEEILSQYKELGLESLPLPVQVSKGICKNWDKGKNTDLYRRLEEIKNV